MGCVQTNFEVSNAVGAEHFFQLQGYPPEEIAMGSFPRIDQRNPCDT